MKYQALFSKGVARGKVLSIALANDGQHQDTGAKMIHLADDTSSNIISKSISIGKGRSFIEAKCICQSISKTVKTIQSAMPF